MSDGGSRLRERQIDPESAEPPSPTNSSLWFETFALRAHPKSSGRGSVFGRNFSRLARGRWTAACARGHEKGT